MDWAGSPLSINLKGDDLEQLDYVADAVLAQIEQIEQSKDSLSVDQSGDQSGAVTTGRELKLPLTKEVINSLKAGDLIYLTG